MNNITCTCYIIIRDGCCRVSEFGEYFPRVNGPVSHDTTVIIIQRRRVGAARIKIIIMSVHRNDDDYGCVVVAAKACGGGTHGERRLQRCRAAAGALLWTPDGCLLRRAGRCRYTYTYSVYIYIYTHIYGIKPARLRTWPRVAHRCADRIYIYIHWAHGIYTISSAARTPFFSLAIFHPYFYTSSLVFPPLPMPPLPSCRARLGRNIFKGSPQTRAPS